jgi:hypothetical protein
MESAEPAKKGPAKVFESSKAFTLHLDSPY